MRAVYPHVLEKPASNACHCIETYTNNRIEADHGAPEAAPATDARPKKRPPSQDHHRWARIHPNIRRSHYKLGVDQAVSLRLGADRLTKSRG